MAKRSYDEKSVINSLKRINGITIKTEYHMNKTHHVITISKDAIVGIHQFGKLDYMRNVHNATIIREK